VGSDGFPPDYDQCFAEMVSLLHKIEVWWIVNVEIPTDPDHDGRKIDETEILPGRVMTLRLLLDVALGDEERSRSYYSAFRNLEANGQGKGGRT
jgi:hypothetical protein